MSPRARTHLLLAGLTVLAVGPTLGSGLMLYDLGELFYYADAIGRGLRPGVDYTVNGYGPGRYLLMAGIFSVTGPSLAAYWAVALLLRLGISASLWSVGRRLLSPRWAALPVICVLLAPGPLHKGFFLLGTLLLFWGLLRWLERPGWRRALAFGGILAGVALFRLDLGLFGLLAVGAVTLGRRERWREGGLALAPLSVGLLITAALLGPGSIGPVLHQVLADAAQNQQIRTPAFPGPGRLLDGDGDAWLLWLPLVVYPALLLRLARTWASLGARRGPLALLLILGVLSANQVRMKPEVGHLLQAGPLLWLSCAVLLSGLTRPRLAVVLGLWLVLGLGSNGLRTHRGSIYTGSLTIPLDRHRLLETPLGPVRLNDGEYRELQPTLAWLGAQPPGPLWVPTNQPLLLPLSGRRDVTGRVGVLYYAGSAEAQRDVIARLQHDPPPLAVFVDDSVEGPERRLAVAAPPVYRYLITHYLEVARFGRFRVMKRIPHRSDRGPMLEP